MAELIGFFVACVLGLITGRLLLSLLAWVVETEWSEAQRVSAVAELAAGRHEGLAVVASPPPPPVSDPNAALKAKIAAVVADSLVPQTMKDVFTEWKKRL